MKSSLNLLICFVLITSCQSTSTKSSTSNSDAKNHAAKVNRKIEIPMRPEIMSDSVVLFKYELDDTLHFDFNGDDLIDHAFFKRSDVGVSLIIKDSRNSKEIKVGEDCSFHFKDANFEWVDIWGVTADTLTYEVLIQNGEIFGTKKVTLDCFSIVLRKEDEGGGMITFKNGAYKWVHQAD